MKTASTHQIRGYWQDKWLPYSSYVLRLLLITIFLYSASISVLDYGSAQYKMQQQAFPFFIADHLTWVNILLQTVAGILILLSIIYDLYTRHALIFAFLILAMYTVYSLLAMLNLTGTPPCTCIGLFETMNWSQTFTLNAVFLVWTSFAYLTLAPNNT